MSALRDSHPEAATLFDAVLAAPDDALPAILAALQVRERQKKLPLVRNQLLKEYGNNPVSRCIEFCAVGFPDDMGCRATLDLVRPCAVRVQIGESTAQDIAVDYLRTVIELIESGALHEPDWSAAYQRYAPDDDLPF